MQEKVRSIHGSPEKGESADCWPQLSHAVVVIEKLTYTSIKLSVLFLYRRIFKSNRTFRILNGGLIVFVCIWGLVFLFLESFVCMAYSPPFDPDQPWLSKLHNSQSGLSCPAQEWVLLWFAITEVLSDVAILSLPYPHIKRLQKSKSTKIGLCVIFGLGAVYYTSTLALLEATD